MHRRGVVLLAVLTLGSCHYATYQEQMQTAELPQAVWSAEHRVTFDSFVEQSRMPHTLYLYVRYNSCYAYTALPLTIELRQVAGQATLAGIETLGVAWVAAEQ